MRFFQGIFQPRNQIQVSCIVGKFFTSAATRQAPPRLLQDLGQGQWEVSAPA